MNELRLLTIRNLIAAREFNTANANHDLSRDGWRWDYTQHDKEIGDQIENLLKQEGVQ